MVIKELVNVWQVGKTHDMQPQNQSNDSSKLTRFLNQNYQLVTL